MKIDSELDRLIGALDDYVDSTDRDIKRVHPSPSPAQMVKLKPSPNADALFRWQMGLQSVLDQVVW